MNEVKKWEYKYVVVPRGTKYNVAQNQYEMNKLGDAGWELVCVEDDLYIYKRQKLDIIGG